MLSDATRAELEDVELDAEELGAQQQRGQLDMPHLLSARKRLVARLAAIMERAVAERHSSPMLRAAALGAQYVADTVWVGED